MSNPDPDTLEPDDHDPDEDHEEDESVVPDDGP